MTLKKSGTGVTATFCVCDVLQRSTEYQIFFLSVMLLSFIIILFNFNEVPKQYMTEFFALIIIILSACVCQ